MLGVPFEYTQPELASTAAEFSAIANIWVTEYNIRDTCGVAQLAWGSALFTTTLSMLYLRTPRVQLLTVWSLGGAAGYTSLFTANSSFDGLCCNLSVPTIINGRTAQGLLLSELSTTIGNGSLVSSLAFAPSPTLSRGFGNGSTYPALLGLRFEPDKGLDITNHTTDSGGGEGVGVFLLNLSPDSHEVDLSAILFAASGSISTSTSTSTSRPPLSRPNLDHGRPDRAVLAVGCSVRQYSAPPALHYNGGSLAGQVNMSIGQLGGLGRVVTHPYSATSVICGR
jgi:hypothetical protein